MLTHFFDYDILDQAIVDKMFSTKKVTFIYDKKPTFQFCNSLLYDTITFKILTWKNKFSFDMTDRIVVLHIKKFSDDMIYTFFRNTFEDVYIFTDDEEFKNNTTKKTAIKTKITFLGEPFYLSLSEFENEQAIKKALLEKSQGILKRNTTIKPPLAYLYNIYLEVYKFVFQLNSKFNILKGNMDEARISGKRITVLTNNELIKFILRDSTIASNSPEKKDSICFVFDILENFEYCEFSECIFAVSLNEKDKANNLINDILEEEFNLCLELLIGMSSIIFPIIDGYSTIGTITFDAFKDYLKLNESNIVSRIVENTFGTPESYLFMKNSEVYVGNVVFPVSCSRQVLDQMVYSIKMALEQVYLYIRGIIPLITYKVGGFMEKEFIANLSFPGLFEFDVASSPKLTKKAANCDAAYKFVLKLVENGILDENLEVVNSKLEALETVKKLLFRAYRTTNKEQIVQLRDELLEGNDENHKEDILVEKNGIIFIERFGNPKKIEESTFKKKYMINLKEDDIQESNTEEDEVKANNINKRIEKFYRKVPVGMSRQSNLMTFYTFSNSQTGVLCASDCVESCYFIDSFGRSIIISGNAPRVYDERELKLLKFYQIIFFKMHNEIFICKEQMVKLYYYVVPLQSTGEIDWEYLVKTYERFIVDFTYNCVSTEELIWNPFISEFLVYADKLNRNIEEEVENTTFLRYFEDKYRVSLTNRTGEMLFKAYLTSQVSSATRKHLNQAMERKTLQEASKLPGYSILEIDISPTEKAPVVEFKPIECTIDIKIPTVGIYPEECCFLTPIKKSIIQEVEIFKRNYFLLEDMLVADELKKAFDLNLKLRDVISCFTQGYEHPKYNYEKYEFIGDCVLKFLTTSYLCLSNLSLDLIVTVKDSMINNENLFRCCMESGLSRYLRIRVFNSKMVQAPSISEIGNLLSYFNASQTFKSNNYGHNIVESTDESGSNIKHYADMVEALIGAIYIESGLDDSLKFINKIKVLNITGGSTVDQEDEDSLDSILEKQFDLPGNFNHATVGRITNKNSLFFGKPLKVFEYTGILMLENIRGIEKAISYTFSNPGNIERALVHPSFTNKLGSTDFQHLELLGDSSIDIFITSLLHCNSQLDTPALLHLAKQSYVNNLSFSKCFYKIGLDKYALHGLKPGIQSKMYSDFIEALVGAILVDLQWDFASFLLVMHKGLKQVFEECKNKNSSP
ncbi:Dicer-like protein 1 [Glugoides intestinalis]